MVEVKVSKTQIAKGFSIADNINQAELLELFMLYLDAECGLSAEAQMKSIAEELSFDGKRFISNLYSNMEK